MAFSSLQVELLTASTSDQDDRKLSDLYELIIPLLENSTAVKVRTLAKVRENI
jgi:hypothetical protein